MENRAYAFAAGLFVLLLGAGVIAAALWLSGETERRVSYMLESRHPVTGLNVQATVRFRGIEVGKVEKIELSKTDPLKIEVRVGVSEKTPITRGTTGQLASSGVTGQSYVMLDDKGTNKEPQPSYSDDPNARIPLAPSFFDVITGAGEEMISDVRKVAARLTVLLDDGNQAQLMRTLAGLETATNRVGELAVKLQPAVKNMPALTDDARKAIARADELMKNLNRLTLEVTQRVDALERIAKSAEQMGGAAQQVGGAAQSVSGTAVSETLPRIHILLEEIGRTSRSLERLLADLNEEPSTIVFGRPVAVPGPGEPGFNPRRGASK
jgi:phospholipid/cholesterol/gamma-HCH transport system substrate-binding protein